ncbi:MAG: hypothetical protein ACRCV5_15530 [Afipia sp.]
MNGIFQSGEMIFSSLFRRKMDPPESEIISQYHFIDEMPPGYDLEASIDGPCLKEARALPVRPSAHISPRLCGERRERDET